MGEKGEEERRKGDEIGGPMHVFFLPNTNKQELRIDWPVDKDGQACVRAVTYYLSSPKTQKYDYVYVVMKRIQHMLYN